MYEGLGNGHAVDVLCADLEYFSREFPDPGNDPVTFVAMFEKEVATEAQFARQMWQHLQAMHEHDNAQFDWASGVSADPSSADFSFSVAGRAFFIVGLSPVASRLSRRAPMPCLVFNFHNQFASLRAAGKYSGLQNAIRVRDSELQGNINPVLANFGEHSEARQYSGQAVGPDWKCPFQQVSVLNAG